MSWATYRARKLRERMLQARAKLERMLQARAKLLPGMICALACATVFACALSSCTPTGTVSDASPRLLSATCAAGSDLTEAGQYVEARLTFDAPLKVSGDASEVASDLLVTLNNEELDAKTIALSAAVEGSDLVVRLVPTPAADGSSPSVYFALYDGQLRVAARGGDGALPHVVAAADEGACAVLGAAVCASVPSGVQWQVVSQQPGEAASDTPAQTTIRVTQFAQVRCVTWLGLSFDGQVARNAYGTPDFTAAATQDGTLALKHNHVFLRDTTRACAADMADVINRAWGARVEAVAEDDLLTMTARTCEDGEQLELFRFEGRYDDEGRSDDAQ